MLRQLMLLLFWGESPRGGVNQGVLMHYPPKNNCLESLTESHFQGVFEISYINQDLYIFLSF